MYEQLGVAHGPVVDKAQRALFYSGEETSSAGHASDFQRLLSSEVCVWGEDQDSQVQVGKQG